MNIFTRLGLEDPMTSGAHVIRCRDTGEALANKLDGGECVCKPGECEMRKLRNREGDYAKNNSEDEGFDATGFAIGLATGFPISPRGITMGSIVGSLLHPTERHASYDVTSATPTIPTDDTQPGTPAAPVRDVDFNDNSTSAPQPIDPPASEPTFRDSDPPPVTDAPQNYSTPDPVPDSAPSYSAPEPSYSAPDPSPSFDSGSSSFGSDSGSSSGGGGGD